MVPPMVQVTNVNSAGFGKNSIIEDSLPPGAKIRRKGGSFPNIIVPSAFIQ